MKTQEKKWNRLKEIRTQFVKGADFSKPYWNSESDLEQYHETLAQRIKWKWEFVFKRLNALGWKPSGNSILDWGCGSGIATLSFLEHFGSDSVSDIHLFDHSSMAVQFAIKKIRVQFPDKKVTGGSFHLQGNETVLISHVVTEMNPEQLQQLTELLKSAKQVLWVDAGTSLVSKTLIDIREKLLSDFKVIAPCTHQEKCELLDSKNQHHWCHFFADSPTEAFTSPEWSEFARNLGIHLNELPLSYLVLDKNASENSTDSTRIIGKSRLYKGYALLLGCNKNGLNEFRLTQKNFPDIYKRLKKSEITQEINLTVSGKEILEFKF